MSTFVSLSVTCAVCKHSFTVQQPASSVTFGSPDLDGRPAPLYRYTMYGWVQECPHCGYVNRRVDRDAKRFYRYGLVCENARDHLRAFDAFLCAAWAADDDRDKRGAFACRRRALSLFPYIRKKRKQAELIRADILRRMGQFDRMIDTYRDYHTKDETVNRIIAFQLARARERDSSCYTVSDCDLHHIRLGRHQYTHLTDGGPLVVLMPADDSPLPEQDDTVLTVLQSSPEKRIRATVTAVKTFSSAEQLFDAYPPEQFGLGKHSAKKLLPVINTRFPRQPLCAVTLHVSARPFL